MYVKDKDTWANPVDGIGKYLTFDGQWWDADVGTARFLASLERPNRESDSGQFRVPLTNERVVAVLLDTGYVAE